MGGSLKDILSNIMVNLEIVATNLGAMEAALEQRNYLGVGEIDAYMEVPHRNARSALANARHWIAALPD
jgi:hypothetical protein